MRPALAKCQASDFHFLFTDDESWMVYSDHREAMWVPGVTWTTVVKHVNVFWGNWKLAASQRWIILLIAQISQHVTSPYSDV
jgi:hypothetical protein